MPMKNDARPVGHTVEVDESQGRVQTVHVVIDCSSFTYIDSVGLHVLPAVSINALTFLYHDTM